MARRTKIIATMGPSTQDPEVVRAMVAAGMDVARLNFSHGTADDHRQMAEWIRAAADAGLSVPTEDAARDIIGLGLSEAVQRLFPGAGAADVERLIDRYREHWLGNQVVASTLFDGAAGLLSRLHRTG